MTGLPLLWGEGEVDAILADEAERPAMLAALERETSVRPLDTIDARQLGTAIAIIAQPRRLTARELVAFDRWVRAGGRAIIFADADLTWPSRWSPGDPRRPPPVTLLDPLFTHWGVVLADPGREPVMLEGGAVLVTAAQWQAPRCAPSKAYVVDCAIGAGRAILVGDADVLRDAANAGWVVSLIRTLDQRRPVDPPDQPIRLRDARTGIEQR